MQIRDQIIRSKQNGNKSIKWLQWLVIVLANLFTYINTVSAQDSCQLRISVITCGVGDELYSCYGHSAVRIVDSCLGSDIVYNYGTFNFGDPEFYSKFTRGKLLYYLNDEDFLGFMNIYKIEGRSVYEQVLNLNESDKKSIQAFLTNNLKEENKYYHYDFLLDNCSTRIRDIFSTIFKSRFEFGHSMADDSCTFRTILDIYEKEKHWERFGINLLMSDVVDNKMSNLQSMFLPDYLMKGLSNARIDDHRLIKETIQLLPQQINIPREINQPKIVFWLLLLGIVLLSMKPGMQQFLKYFDVFFFMILGLLGCFMLFMWLGTEHLVCAWNRNIMWAFPLHIVFAFLIPRESELIAKYARYASWLVILSMIYGLFAEQKYIAEITPILLLIIFRLGKYSSQMNFVSFNTKRWNA